MDGFTTTDIAVARTTIHARIAGSGPPVLLLHGYPQNHRMWSAVATRLTAHHTVVAADLRGYGDSGKPAPASDHSTYAKTVMAADQAQLMTGLGFERFAVVGHDRGARVAHRLCLDHPQRITHAAVLDIVPTLHMFEHTDQHLADAYFHFFFLAQAADLPERMIGADADHWLLSALQRWSGPDFDPDTDLDPHAVADYLRCFRDPATITATCEDYRAAATIDLEHDRATRAAGRRIHAPLLALYGTHGFIGRHYDVARIWRDYAHDVTTHGVDCGHFLPEEAPTDTTGRLLAHLAERRGHEARSPIE